MTSSTGEGRDAREETLDLKLSISEDVGSSPLKSSRHDSRKLDFSANSEISKPRYLKIPLSPSMKVISLSQDPVLP